MRNNSLFRDAVTAPPPRTSRNVSVRLFVGIFTHYMCRHHIFPRAHDQGRCRSHSSWRRPAALLHARNIQPRRTSDTR